MAVMHSEVDLEAVLAAIESNEDHPGYKKIIVINPGTLPALSATVEHSIEDITGFFQENYKTTKKVTYLLDFVGDLLGFLRLLLATVLDHKSKVLEQKSKDQEDQALDPIVKVLQKQLEHVETVADCLVRILRNTLHLVGKTQNKNANEAIAQAKKTAIRARRHAINVLIENKEIQIIADTLEMAKECKYIITNEI